MISLVYSAQVGQPFKLPEKICTICGRNKEVQGLSVVFRFFNGNTISSSALFMKVKVRMLSFNYLWTESCIHFGPSDCRKV